MLAAVRFLHNEHGLHMARHEFWILVEARCPSAPALTGVGREHKDGVNSYWWRYSAPVRLSLFE